MDRHPVKGGGVVDRHTVTGRVGGPSHGDRKRGKWTITHRRHIECEPDRVEHRGRDGTVLVRVPDRLIVTVEAALERPARQVKR